MMSSPMTGYVWVKFHVVFHYQLMFYCLGVVMLERKMAVKKIIVAKIVE